MNPNMIYILDLYGCFVILSYRFGIIQFKFTGRKSYDEGKFYSICRD